MNSAEIREFLARKAIGLETRDLIEEYADLLEAVEKGEAVVVRKEDGWPETTKDLIVECLWTNRPELAEASHVDLCVTASLILDALAASQGSVCP